MGLYLLKRVGLMVPTLLVILLINFILIKGSPVTPADFFNLQEIQFFEGRGTTKENKKTQETFLAQLADFTTLLQKYAKGDFGISEIYDAPVWDVIQEPLLISFFMTVGALILSYLLAFFLLFLYLKGSYKGQSRLMFFLIFAQSIPKILIALFLILLLASEAGIALFPFYGLVSEGSDVTSWVQKSLDWGYHLVLPILTLTFSKVPKLTTYLIDLTRAELRKPYVVFARSRGLDSQTLLRREILPNLKVPLLTRLPTDVTFLMFTYTLIVEIIFSVPGVGYIGYKAITSGDQFLFLGIFFLFSFLNVILTLLSDALIFRSVNREGFSHG